MLLTGNGAPIAEKKASLTVGPHGPMLIQDFVYLDEMSHFARERIPERVVHAKGAGTFIRHVLIALGSIYCITERKRFLGRSGIFCVGGNIS